ncbi:hypothetical protein [Geomonas subterranea]|uniref:hypothetical protein n=1 Tax=Geomonas subterranea TaxID=2847989 RepID=UPI001CD5F3D5|nr:hypothetical protein [Geomonas fuzhouensis]
MKLLELLTKLPNVKPRVAKAALKGWENDLLNQIIAAPDRDTSRMRVKIGHGIKFGFRDIDNIFCQKDMAPIEVTPYGAGLVVQLYSKGLLPMTKNQSPGEVPEEVKEYAKTGEKVAEVRMRIRDHADAERIAYREILSRPAEIKPSSFTSKLLNDIFIYHHGLGGGAKSMEIGGAAVTKKVRSFSSNSGNSRDWEVIFSWTDENGAPQELMKPSNYAENRRNDADRNFGLPE